eukprot:CAMPEP_0202965574 /NCGR_PEP_ID=MMETSP1396-20130829/9501_1 /ASSEMBLY_ACC=CAM_ASM_000872 /TAXON_ID= /ORGANISM="Pseudokeronopsis sp., Strain Brazil" /LENGTH=249 /DNA_ID=CAMNT_0049688327 /DNA_START=361 /DNA_END=1107 /DNA_ORIENTATION=-
MIHLDLLKSKVEAYISQMSEAKKHLDRIDGNRGGYYSNTFVEALAEPKKLMREVFEDLQKEHRRLMQITDYRRNFLGSSTIIKDQDERDMIFEWTGKKYMNTQPIYVGTRHGFKAAKFHEKCDNQGPTILLLKTKGDRVFGAYCAYPFNSAVPNGAFNDTSDSFLFSVTKRMKLCVAVKQNAVFNHPKMMPHYGDGPDLKLCEDCDINNASFANLGKSYKLPPGIQFDTDDAKTFLADEFKFLTEEIEV